jgi:MFS family permease
MLAVVVSLSAAAALAIGILLFGEFGETEGRILATTALVAFYGLLALPAAILLDQARLAYLATAVLALSGVGLSLALATVWSGDPPEVLGKSLTAVTAFGAALTQTSALAGRRRERDSTAVRRLFAVSVVLAVVLAALVTTAVWAEIEDNDAYFRILAAVAVLDALVVALQPILAFARPAREVHRLRISVEPTRQIERTVEAADFAGAAAKAIRATERDGSRVLRLERIE